MMIPFLWMLLVNPVVGWTTTTRRSSSILQDRISTSSRFPQRSPPFCTRRGADATPTTTRLAMGLMDSLSNFLSKRQGDFVKLESSSLDTFGPGPLLVAYGIPTGIDHQEIQDMLADGAPTAASNKNCKIIRLTAQDDNVLDRSLDEALNGLVQGSITVDESTSSPAFDVPVLFFSGFRNDEMLAVYNILGKEIYEETGGRSSTACAKAVPNAMGKVLRQVLDEISGDHKDAISLTDAEGDDQKTTD